jgi:hypothetical protein
MPQPPQPQPVATREAPAVPWPGQARELAEELQRQLAIGDRDWHALKRQRPRRGAEQHRPGQARRPRLRLRQHRRIAGQQRGHGDVLRRQRRRQRPHHIRQPARFDQRHAFGCNG